MVEITEYVVIYKDSGIIDYVHVSYIHGDYELSVYSDGDYDIFNEDIGFICNKYIEIDENVEEYENFVKMDLQLNNLYKGEEL